MQTFHELSILNLICGRHQLVPDEDLGPLYDLLIDEPAEIRHAIGALVYDHLIAQKFNSSQSGAKGVFQDYHNYFFII